MTPDQQTGVVLSGGGANGAYEVGVLKALSNGASPVTGGHPLNPGSFTGTSVGAFNGAIMVSQPGASAAATVEHLELIWRHRIASTSYNCGNGVYRVRGLPLQSLDPGCLRNPVQSLIDFGKDTAALSAFGLLQGARFVSSDTSLQSRLLSLVDLEAFISESPLLSLIQETVDLDGMRRSDKELTIVTSDWKRGVVRLISKREITESLGTDAILASTAIPGIFPPVDLDGVPFVDGGLLMNTPFKPMIRQGATTFHVIFLDPLIENIPIERAPSTLDTFYRVLAIIWAARVRADVAIASAINRTLDLLERTRLDPGTRAEVRTFLEVGERIYRRNLEGRPYRKLTIHVYRPPDDLGGGEGLLDFNANRLDELIELGYRDAVNHDCDASGCAVPGGGGE